jgi:hypothetical protein
VHAIIDADSGQEELLVIEMNTLLRDYSMA